MYYSNQAERSGSLPAERHERRVGIFKALCARHQLVLPNSDLNLYILAQPVCLKKKRKTATSITNSVSFPYCKFFGIRCRDLHSVVIVSLSDPVTNSTLLFQ